ncbi:MAG: chloride channel protein, partial [Mycobacteriales bacterium]
MPEASASRTRQQGARQVRWSALGAVAGVLSGLASAAFLESLAWATRTRVENTALLFLLPLGGLAVGLAYHYGGGRAAEGTALLTDEIHEPRGWLPRRMAPLVFIGTVVTHVFGGSAGREGAAIQMAGSLTDTFSRSWRLRPDTRRMLLIAAIAGGFGAVFGVPFAGCAFALEVQAVGRVRYDALVPALVASVVGDHVVRALGVGHQVFPRFADLDVSVWMIGRVAVAGLCCGLVARTFVALTHALKRGFAWAVAWPPARPVVGGALVVALTYAVGSRAYLGLSLPLVSASIAPGVGVATFAFALKLLFTSLTLGSGFQGGEVTPLFVIGATLG